MRPISEKFEAMLYEKREGGFVRCLLCPHRCLIAAGKRGLCGVRENRGGILYSLVYGQVIATHVDPIEKKPLYHFLPGSRAYSVATVGCNLSCLHCQNADISQGPRETGSIGGREIAPAALVAEAGRSDCRTIAYTYTEPTVFFEYAYETAVLGRREGIRNIFVTNGYMTEPALRTIAPYLDGANVDLKSFREEFYQTVCGARLAPVLETIQAMSALGIWLEVTTLVIPEHNDSEEELAEIARFIAGVNPQIPWHVSAFYPTYRLTSVGRTSPASLIRAREIGLRAGLHYVYTGNISGGEGENTYCHHCGKLLIKRVGYLVGEVHLREGACEYCGTPAPGVWK